MSLKRTVVVSPEITGFIGRGGCDAAALPDDPLILGFGDIGEPAVRAVTAQEIVEQADGDLVVLAISRSACDRLFGIVPDAVCSWYLSAELRGVGRAIVAAEGDDEAADLLRAARCVELLCALFAALCEKRLVAVRGATTLSETDVMLIAAAHQIVNENWQQPLTVGSIARRCGLNKAKLTRGFRELYQCTLPEAVSERRLGRARQLLAQSDLPVSTVGYRCGYRSNASFTRAFSRRFGMTPTDLRRREKYA